jgi:hypothetical protein
MTFLKRITRNMTEGIFEGTRVQKEGSPPQLLHLVAAV